MTHTINIVRVSEQSEKAVKIVLRESGYCLKKFKEIKEISHWVPKSLISIDGNEVTIAKWFFDKNIAVDNYNNFMKSLANS